MRRSAAEALLRHEYGSAVSTSTRWPPPAVDLKAGDLARLQVQQERRLIIVESMTSTGNKFSLTFTGHAMLFGYPPD